MSIVAGGAGTVMSGGTLVIAGVAVSVKGVVLGGAMTAAGGAIASRAVFAMGADMTNVRYYSSGGKPPDKVTFDSKQLGAKWGEHMKDYPKLKSHSNYKSLANNIFKKPETIIFDSKNKEWYYLKGNDLLRLKPNGDFISLYPGAKSSRVLNAIK